MVRTRMSLGGRVRGFSGKSNQDCGNRSTTESGEEPWNREASTPMEVPTYDFLTTQEEMVWHLAFRIIQLPNFTYDFEIVYGERQLSDTGGVLFCLSIFQRLVSISLCIPFFA